MDILVGCVYRSQLQALQNAFFFFIFLCSAHMSARFHYVSVNVPSFYVIEKWFEYFSEQETHLSVTPSL